MGDGAFCHYCKKHKCECALCDDCEINPAICQAFGKNWCSECFDAFIKEQEIQGTQMDSIEE